jgi:hypothetical protein
MRGGNETLPFRMGVWRECLLAKALELKRPQASNKGVPLSRDCCSNHPTTLNFPRTSVGLRASLQP